MGTLISWLKTYYTTIGQYPTLYDYLAITREDLIRLEYHLDNPNTSVKPEIFRFTLPPPTVYPGEMHDSTETRMRMPHLSCHRYDMSVCHTPLVTCPYVCQSRKPSVHCTVHSIGPSVCQAYTTPVRHTVMTTSQSVCQSRDPSVCYPTRDARHALCSSSVTSVLPSAITTVKIPTSIPVRNPFPYYHVPGKIPFVRTSTELSVHHPDSLSINSSPSAANLSKFPCNDGEIYTVNSR